jgi:hypothetical protein
MTVDQVKKFASFDPNTREGIAARNNFMKEIYEKRAAECPSDGKVGFAALRLAGGVAAGILLPVAGSLAVGLADEGLTRTTNVGSPLDVLKQSNSPLCKMIRPPSPSMGGTMGGGG